MTEKLCRACGRVLVASATGRPPRWCSRGCRRAVEAKIRRLERQALALALEEAALRRRSAGAVAPVALLAMAVKAKEQVVEVEPELLELFQVIEG
jgi:hypothetical protein